MFMNSVKIDPRGYFKAVFFGVCTLKLLFIMIIINKSMTLSGMLYSRWQRDLTTPGDRHPVMKWVCLLVTQPTSIMD